MSQFTRNIVATIIVVVVLELLGIGASELAKKSPSKQTTGTSQSTVAPISYAGQEGKSVLELLKANHQVESVDSSYGTYVQSIDGKASTETSVWLYYVNNEPGLEAADKTITKDGQTIE